MLQKTGSGYSKNLTNDLFPIKSRNFSLEIKKMFQNTWCTEPKIFKIYLDLKPNKKVEILRTNDKSTRGKNSKAYHICQAMKW